MSPSSLGSTHDAAGGVGAYTVGCGLLHPNDMIPTLGKLLSYELDPPCAKEVSRLVVVIFEGEYICRSRTDHDLGDAISS